jgi:hypothetical protein
VRKGTFGAGDGVGVVGEWVGGLRSDPGVRPQLEAGGVGLADQLLPGGLGPLVLPHQRPQGRQPLVQDVARLHHDLAVLRGKRVYISNNEQHVAYISVYMDIFICVHTHIYSKYAAICWIEGECTC